MTNKIRKAGDEAVETAIVTGASHGIGLAVAKSLTEGGIQVYGFGRDFSGTPLQSPLFHAVAVDLTNIRELLNTVRQIKNTADICYLINNAGVGYFGLHEELNAAAIHEMVMVNVEVPMVLAQELLRDLKKQKGCIINISSVTARKSNPHGCAYGATKAALTGFTNSLIDEVRKYGVRVAVIHPDMTKSDFYRNADFQEEDAQDTCLMPEDTAAAVMEVIRARDGMMITDITLMPQRHRICRKTKND